MAKLTTSLCPLSVTLPVNIQIGRQTLVSTFSRRSDRRGGRHSPKVTAARRRKRVMIRQRRPRRTKMRRRRSPRRPNKWAKTFLVSVIATFVLLCGSFSWNFGFLAFPAALCLGVGVAIDPMKLLPSYFSQDKILLQYSDMLSIAIYIYIAYLTEVNKKLSCICIILTFPCFLLETYIFSCWTWCRRVVAPIMDNGDHPKTFSVCSTDGWWGTSCHLSSKQRKLKCNVCSLNIVSLSSSYSSSTSNKATRPTLGPSAGPRSTASTLRNSPGTDLTSGLVSLAVLATGFNTHCIPDVEPSRVLEIE